jgi:hypothetical protein
MVWRTSSILITALLPLVSGCQTEPEEVDCDLRAAGLCVPTGDGIARAVWRRGVSDRVLLWR